MNAVPAPKTREGSRFWRYTGVAVLYLIMAAALVFSVVQVRSDGPLTAIVAGGAFRSGPIVTEPVSDWTAVLGGRGACRDGVCPSLDPIELQLVDPPTSRYIGVMLHDGRLYLPCDLGYMWNRFAGAQRRVLQLIYYFKHWHEDAVHDGRAVLRIDGKRYAGQAVRVTDPELIRALKADLEEMARAWVAPDPLPPAPAEGPNDIWFFRFDQPQGSSVRNP